MSELLIILCHLSILDFVLSLQWALVELDITISLRSFKPAWNFHQVFMMYCCFKLDQDPNVKTSLPRHNDVTFHMYGSNSLYAININFWSV